MCQLSGTDPEILETDWPCHLEWPWGISFKSWVGQNGRWKRCIISLQEFESNTEHSEWIFGIRFNEFTLSQKEKMELNLFQSGIDTRKMFYPISTHKHIPFLSSNENISSQLNHQCILIPSYPDLTFSQLEYIATTIKKFMQEI